MNKTLRRKLEFLRADYASVTGRPFKHFVCPLLFRDEDVELCDGHVINQAFSGTDRTTVVQRADVDSFFGSRFESDFVLLDSKGKYAPVDVLLDSELSRKLRPRIFIDGVQVPHYLPRGAVPDHHSELAVQRENQSEVKLALKLVPSQTLAALGGKWEIDMAKDIRLPALVSLLKAAHLTLFSMLGYTYALSAAGHFVGWDMLGSFATANMGLERAVVVQNARAHFREYAALVRPLLRAPIGIRGTVSDRQVFLCTGSPKAWAFLVFVRTGDDTHAVLLPIFEDADGAARFISFLRNPAPRFEIRRALFADDRWEVSKTAEIIDWPEGRLE